MQTLAALIKEKPPYVTILIAYTNAAPVQDQVVEIGEVQYQKSDRGIPDALRTYMADYEEAIRFLSSWSDVPTTVAFQSDLFSDSAMPRLLNYLIRQRTTLGPQLSPSYGKLALRAACPVSGCDLEEKHGLLNDYEWSSSGRSIIVFRCPNHGPHTIRLSHPAEVARLEVNAPTYNLLRSMIHLFDTTKHHIRVTGADYSGMHQETLLHRPLAAWSAATGLARGRTPHILHAPLIVVWSGTKLSKPLYVRDGAHASLKYSGMDRFCSYAQLRDRFGGNGDEGLRIIWDIFIGIFARSRYEGRAEIVGNEWHFRRLPVCIMYESMAMDGYILLCLHGNLFHFVTPVVTLPTDPPTS
ncbi:hypothetical protein F4813DRAFT_221091 [Daldinia decipiens]|uniref:uncharacterized protein n=1 Tax=Daldinia decipiens TaxID=326647 RepID=UPI0020C4DEFD|nr:uncharacterized protein F4813DRAFT_221091 [Daldinia decipiens]KAI1661207.1 hypothetical protein F4813DRAFT_221091 [Daldinia decipiens]